MKFLLTPENSSYSVEKSIEETMRAQLEGGAGRYRADILGASNLVNCSWILDGTQFTYFEAFYRSVAGNGALPFTIDLIINDAELREYTARFVPKTKKLTAQKGLAYYVSAQLEVNDDTNPGIDLVTVLEYNASQGYTP